MSLSLTERAQAYRTAALQVHEIEIAERPESDRLEEIKAVLTELSQRPGLFPTDTFPRAPSSPGGLFRLAQAPDGRGGLYVSLGFTGRGGTSPHTHASWAVVVGVSGGVETNRVYERIDDGSAPGEAELRLKEEIAVGPGEAVLLPTGAFHTIDVISDTPVLHLHAYGRAVETPGVELPLFEAPTSRTYTLRTSGAFQPPLPAADPAEVRREAVAGRLAVVVLESGHGGFAGPHVVAATPGRLATGLAGVDKTLPIVVVGSPDVADLAGSELYADGRAVVFRLAEQGVQAARR